MSVENRTAGFGGGRVEGEGLSQAVVVYPSPEWVVRSCVHRREQRGQGWNRVPGPGVERVGRAARGRRDRMRCRPIPAASAAGPSSLGPIESVFHVSSLARCLVWCAN